MTCLLPTLNLTRGKSRLPLAGQKCKKLNWPRNDLHSISLILWAARGDEETYWISEMHASCLNPRRRIGNAMWDDTWSGSRRQDSAQRRLMQPLVLKRMTVGGLSLVTGTGCGGGLTEIGGEVVASIVEQTTMGGSLSMTSSFKAFLQDSVIFSTNMGFNSIQLSSSQELIMDCPLQNLTQILNSIRQLISF